MDAQLQKLIEKIKEDGIKTAQEESKKILDEAKVQADKTIAAAKTETETIRSEAKSNAVQAEARGREALKQAGRDLLLSLREEIRLLFDGFLKEGTGKALHETDLIKSALSSVLSGWTPEKMADLSVLLPEAQSEELQKALKASLAEKIKNGLELKPGKRVDSGFLISEKDGSAFYDFSAETMAESLAEYLNPKLAALIQDAAKES